MGNIQVFLWLFMSDISDAEDQRTTSIHSPSIENYYRQLVVRKMPK